MLQEVFCSSLMRFVQTFLMSLLPWRPVFSGPFDPFPCSLKGRVPTDYEKKAGDESSRNLFLEWMS